MLVSQGGPMGLSDPQVDMFRQVLGPCHLRRDQFSDVCQMPFAERSAGGDKALEFLVACGLIKKNPGLIARCDVYLVTADGLAWAKDGGLEERVGVLRLVGRSLAAWWRRTRNTKLAFHR